MFTRHSLHLRSCSLFLILIGALCTISFGENGSDAWLRYAPIQDQAVQERYSSLPSLIVDLRQTEVSGSAANELSLGLQHMLGKTVQKSQSLSQESALVLGTGGEVRKQFPGVISSRVPGIDGFIIRTLQRAGKKYWLLISDNDRGILYATFFLLSQVAQQKDISDMNVSQTPSAPIRWASQWDNLDGTIERGYAGHSIFFDNGNVRSDLTRAGEYARLLASIGINACSINNVNADPRVLHPDFTPQLARVASAFRPWGVRLAISVDLSSPKTSGGLDTFDPLDPKVAAWWKLTVDRIYQLVPDFAGFVIKADSEGRSGPSQYGRNAADAANVIGRALQPHNGVLLYRAFVYNHHLDWRDLKNDRARAAYDYFHPLDGKFEPNVVLQIKYGPIDFQVREPASPLFGSMRQTSEAIELQVTQEYTGQQRHLCFLAPMWKEVLDFDMHVQGATPAKEIVAGDVWKRGTGGYNAVVNVGLDANWLGHLLAMANLYAYGRLAWNPDLTSEEIAAEWTRLTFGNNPQVVTTIAKMLLASWHIYENYTGPLGAGTLTNITGPHYGPGVESSERNGWGQWHRADANGVGMDRTMATGTGYIGQYSPAVRKLYEPLKDCPDNLLLFMHHVPYTYVLHSGKTVIQHIYDLHYAGAEEAANLVEEWKSLHSLVDDDRYTAVLSRLQYQSGHAIVWRDAVVNWFNRISGIPDQQNRVGHHPDRIEAENMQLSGYAPVEVTPWETASGGKGIACNGQSSCSASFRFQRPSGTYDVAVQYFDQNNGVSHLQLSVNDRLIDSWAADDQLPSSTMNGDSSTRRIVPGVELQTNDLIKIVGEPNREEPAPLDYVAITPRK